MRLRRHNRRGDLHDREPSRRRGMDGSDHRREPVRGGERRGNGHRHRDRDRVRVVVHRVRIAEHHDRRQPRGRVQADPAGSRARPSRSCSPSCRAAAAATCGSARSSGLSYDYRGGALSGTPVVTLPNVSAQGECGLLGLAFDPNYATNGYVYVSYVVSTTNSSGTIVPYSRLSRFTASGGTINPATEKVYYQGNQVAEPAPPGQRPADRPGREAVVEHRRQRPGDQQRRGAEQHLRQDAAVQPGRHRRRRTTRS